MISDLTEDHPGFEFSKVLVELVWVLQSSYEFSSSGISGVLEGLLSASERVVEGADAPGSTLHLYDIKRFGFSDRMIRQASGRPVSHHLASFDRKAALVDDVEWVGLKQSQ